MISEDIKQPLGAVSRYDLSQLTSSLITHTNTNTAILIKRIASITGNMS